MSLLRTALVVGMNPTPSCLVHVRMDDHAEAWVPVPEVLCNDIRVGDTVRYSDDPRVLLVPLPGRRPAGTQPFRQERHHER